ncbi:MAG TPA: FHA domain-containing protein [Gemmataceae bacterium]|jgi:hypothetical protein|nr:FHA domain-containing protein [Gemmataceae bacterium]
MLGFGWLALRQAKDALKHGRLEEAQRLLGQPAAQGRKGVSDLLVELARAYVERGERALNHDDAEAAWRDLLTAEALQTAEKTSDRLRQALTRLGLAELRALLLAGETARAEESVARLRQRNVRSPEVQVLDEATRAWAQARELADHGEFAGALDAAERARRLLGPGRLLDEFKVELERRQQNFSGMLVRLLEAADANRWREVVETAEAVLAAAPQHAEARKARTRAWKAIEPVTVAMPSPSLNGAPKQEALACEGTPARFLLWIDGVGGYLVCLSGRLTFGQAAPDAHVDVPLVADVSRLHATLGRDAEGYVLEAVRPIQVNAKTATRALLQPGDRVTLGTSCQFLFRQPVPLSSTARIDLVSGHRLPVGVDAVLLMAETLVLGSDAKVHINVPDLKESVVLFRHKDGLGLRHQGTMTVNGQKCSQRGLLGCRAHVVAGEVAFALEPVGARIGQN